MTIHISKDDALRSLTTAVEQKGADYVYERPSTRGFMCMYTDPETKAPSCLVATAVSILGLDHTQLTEGVSSNSALRRLRNEGAITIDDDALRAYSTAQASQDTGDSWGVALNNASMTLEEGEYTE